MKLYWTPSTVLLLLTILKQPHEAFTQERSHHHRQSRNDENRRRRHRNQRQHQGNTNDNSAKDGFAFGHASTFHFTRTRRPSHVVEAAYESLVVGTIAAAASTGAFVGLPLWTWFRHNPPSNQTAIQYWNSKTTALAIGIVAGGITGSLIVMGGAAIAMGKLILGMLNTPAIIWETSLRGKNYWNSTSAQWERYSLEKHARELDDIFQSHISTSSSSVKDQSLYQLLNVMPSASSKEIKRAFYKLAKECHPDKNSDPKSQNKFLELHTAYETLYHPDKRRLYDEYGISVVGGENESLHPVGLGINVDIFFEVLLGFSQKVEQYVGDLSIASFSRMMVDMMDVVAIVSRSSPSEQQRLFQQFESYKIFFDAKGRSIPEVRTEQRQVDIALYLKSFVRQFIVLSRSDKDVADSVFRSISKQEAIGLAESTPFASFFLKSIGQALFWECGKGNRWNPLGIWGTARRSTGRSKHWSRLLTKSARVLRKLHREYTNEKIKLGIIDFDGEFDETNFQLLREAQQRAIRSVFSLSSIMESLVWPMIDMDISKTLEGACWKVLNDHDEVENEEGVNMSGRQKLHQQMHAFRILGQEFLGLGSALDADHSRECQNDDEGQNLYEKSSGSFTDCKKPSEDSLQDMQHRIQVAVFMARSSHETKDNVYRQSEEMIHDLRQHKVV